MQIYDGNIHLLLEASMTGTLLIVKIKNRSSEMIRNLQLYLEYSPTVQCLSKIHPFDLDAGMTTWRVLALYYTESIELQIKAIFMGNQQGFHLAWISHRIIPDLSCSTNNHIMKILEKIPTRTISIPGTSESIHSICPTGPWTWRLVTGTSKNKNNLIFNEDKIWITFSPGLVVAIIRSKEISVYSYDPALLTQIDGCFSIKIPCPKESLYYTLGLALKDLYFLLGTHTETTLFLTCYKTVVSLLNQLQISDTTLSSLYTRVLNHSSLDHLGDVERNAFLFHLENLMDNLNPQSPDMEKIS